LGKNLMAQVDAMKHAILVAIVQVISGYDISNFSQPRWKDF
jgi:hypothetical protein